MRKADQTKLAALLEIELVQVGLPVLLEAVCVVIFIAGAIAAVAIYATRVPS